MLYHRAPSCSSSVNEVMATISLQVYLSISQGKHWPLTHVKVHLAIADLSIQQMETSVKVKIKS